MENSALLLFELIRRAITDNNLEELEQQVKRLSIEDLPSQVVIQIFLKFLDLAAKNNRKEIIRFLFREFELRTNPNADGEVESSNSLISDVLREPNVEYDILQGILDAFSEDLSYEELALNLIDGDADTTLQIALKRLELLGQQNQDIYARCLSHATEIGNRVAIEYFSAIYAENASETKKPSWMIPVPLDATIPDPNKKVGLEDVFSNLSSDLSKILTKESFLEAQELTNKSHLFDDPNQRDKINLYNYRVFLRRDVNLFRAFGPANIMDGYNFAGDHICERYGGCRMLLCTCLDRGISNDPGGVVDDEDLLDSDDEFVGEFYDSEIPNWFTGTCEQCLTKIEKSSYAVRYPSPNGGWRWTFCSVECLRGYVEQHNLYDNNVDDLEDELDKIGIWDR